MKHSDMRTLYFFGDSICFGQYISTDRVWTSGVARSLGQSELFQDVVTQVTAVNGETSREALLRIHHCVVSHAPNVVWVQFGLNDSNFWQTDLGLPRVSERSYTANIEEMIQRCLSSGARKILVATNHSVSKRLNHEPDSDRYEKNAASYNQALRDLLTTYSPENVSLVDMELEINRRFNNKADYLLADGVHLNHAGHHTYLEIALDPIMSALTLINSNE